MRQLKYIVPFRAALLLSALLSSEAATAAKVRGRLDRKGPNGVYPATGVAVTLYNARTGRSSPSYTSSDGSYYISNVPEGDFYLELWPYSGGNPVTFPITVKNPGTDIPPITIDASDKR